MSLTLKEKKELARNYYVDGRFSQKEISKIIGITEKTLSKWANENSGEWKKLKEAINSTFENELIRLKKQLNEFNDYIETKPEGKRFGSSAEYDALMKLRKFIDYFDKHPIGITISIMSEFLSFYKKIDLDEAKKLSSVVDSFIKSKI